MKRLVFSLLLVMVGPLTTRAQDYIDSSLNEAVDIDQLKSTWRNLGNERVRFPLDMQDIAVRIGPERQLLVDNMLLARADNVTRQVHQPVRHPGNPVFKADKAERNQAVVETVLHFDQSPHFRMWYVSWDDWQTLPSGQLIRFANSYAVSDDGIQWERPELDLHTVKGLVGPNNVVIPYGQMQGIFYRPDETDPNRRFQSLVLVERKNPPVREGYYLHYSPDGVHWKGDLSRPVLPSLTSGYGIPQNGIGDTTRFWWDPIRERYIGDVKFVVSPGTVRGRGVMESSDMVHWSRATPTFMARRSETQIYGHWGCAYQGVYLGLRWVFVPERSRRHSTYVELDCSRDGRIWTRVGAGQPLMEFNDRHDTWDASIMRPISMLEVGEEVWIYYFGAPTEIESANDKLPAGHQTDYALGLATLKRDRFVSINGGEKPGVLTTRPLTFEGNQLHVNAQVAEGGRLRMALVTEDNRPIDGFRFDDCLQVVGDGIDMKVAWKGGSALPAAVRPRLKFELKQASLFSFWIE
jgi:hypothetical protein